jgi:hypothetical protein
MVSNQHLVRGADPGFLERVVQPLKKGTHDRGAAPIASAFGAKIPQKNFSWHLGI